MYFNPHSRTGSDLNIKLTYRRDGEFQSTLPHGEWRFRFRTNYWYCEFQSTLPHGEWLLMVLWSQCTMRRFQSTLPHGEWLTGVANAGKNIVISIHTPARGVTYLRSNCCKGNVISIHTPARGVTDVSSSLKPINGISIHTPARGVTWL